MWQRGTDRGYAAVTSIQTLGVGVDRPPSLIYCRTWLPPASLWLIQTCLGG